MTADDTQDETWADRMGYPADPVELARVEGRPIEVTVPAPLRGWGGTVGTLTRLLDTLVSNADRISTAIHSQLRR